MSGTLICTVGGTPEPIAFSLANFSQPDRVIFISSQGSTTVIDDALSLNGRLGFALDASRISRIELSDPQNIHTCVREMEQTLNNLVAQTNSPQDPLVVDVTGGTKPMSAALMLVARRWDCQFRYVGGAHRSKEGLGVVSTGTEFLSECTNPMDELGYAAVEDALALANRASYSAARDVLKQAQSRVSGEDAKRALRALEFVVHLFALRDRFQFRQALGQLHNLHHHHSLLNAVIDRRTAELVLEAEPAWRAQLETLSNNCVSTELIAELLANADRRFKEERFDDGVARLYRATEAIAQFALSKSHGIPRTSRVPAERLPGALREEFGPRIKNGTVSLGLQDDYRLLSAVADPLGECFTRLGLEDRRSSLLETRISRSWLTAFNRLPKRPFHSAIMSCNWPPSSGSARRTCLDFPPCATRDSHVGSTPRKHAEQLLIRKQNSCRHQPGAHRYRLAIGRNRVNADIVFLGLNPHLKTRKQTLHLALCEPRRKC